MFLLGLTGSIGMGKSTTAKMFAELGCAVWDADAAVHRLYAQGGAAVSAFQKELPDAVVAGEVSRPALKNLIDADPTVLKKIEAIVHPLVGEDRAAFLADTKAEIVVLDIPLIFETGGNKRMDAVACVTVSAEIQQNRVMERGTMTLEQFENIRAKQMPNDEKCALADYVIETDTLPHARAQVQAVIDNIKGKLSHA
ncbi:MAG: dephospho-CoA kinase [Rhodobacterales bacterium]|jgi:dephospho-CoA kinase|uniref:dephospho-CoA kinase n=1 Tax=Sulfitobacter sp. BSw21498 TaxID=664426 RepID=UPI001110EDA3|nr:dephospho-CoA kinase [Sulfitobacter sp. BSw21498]|tara:strand:+ start:14859 stop:15449 length:591 start_codon:yes stop_codon:yes gene_type:complete